MNLKLDHLEPAVAQAPSATAARLGPMGRGDETPPQAVVLGMHRSGTSALTGLLDRLGFYAGPDESLLAADEGNARGYWELGELHAFDEELLAALGGSWTDVLNIDPRRLGDSARGHFLPRARALICQLNSYGPWVIKDPRLCLLLPFWRELLERPLCILIYRDPLAVARSLARRSGLPVFVGIALWEVYNRAALAASQGLPRVLVGYRGLVDDPAAAASTLRRTLAACGVRGVERLRELSPADARTLLDSSLDHHAAASDEDFGYLNARQRELLHALESGTALLDPVPPLSAGAREVLQEQARHARELVDVHARHARELVNVQARHARELVDVQVDVQAAQQQEVAKREALLAAVFASRSWRLGFGLTRLFGLLRGRRAPTALDRWQSLRDDD